jgi:hypothetical protein
VLPLISVLVAAPIDAAILVGDAAVRAVVAGFVAIAISLLILPLVAHEALVPAGAIVVVLRVDVVGNPVLPIKTAAVGAVAVGVFVAVLPRVQGPTELHAVLVDTDLELVSRIR